MSAPTQLTRSFVPLFRKDEFLCGYALSNPNDKNSRRIHSSIHVGKRWSSELTNALPTYSESRGLYEMKILSLQVEPWRDIYSQLKSQSFSVVRSFSLTSEELLSNINHYLMIYEGMYVDYKASSDVKLKPANGYYKMPFVEVTVPYHYMNTTSTIMLFFEYFNVPASSVKKNLERVISSPSKTVNFCYSTSTREVIGFTSPGGELFMHPNYRFNPQKQP